MTTVPVGAALFDIVNVQNWTRRRFSGPFNHARFRNPERRRAPFVNLQELA